MMGIFTISRLLRKTKPLNRISFIQEKCKGKRVLDLGCIRHSADFALRDPNWLHKKIKLVASEVVGVDYLSDEIRKLNACEYNIIFGDVTKPLDVEGQFDVIIAGDLIEHLINFSGFFENCKRLLNANGILIISTPNPFYAELFHFLIFKKTFLINPEHVCWIDPQALSQLAERFGFYIEEAHYIYNCFRIKGLICQGSNNQYDILNERWLNNSFKARITRRLLGTVFQIFYLPFKLATGGNSALVKHSDYLAVLKKST